MKVNIVVLVMLCFFGCAKKDKSPYVQQQDIQLEQPRVKASNTIIDSSVVITSELRMKGVEIFYTSDGSEPSKSSETYKSALVVSEEGSYKFKAFHPDWKPSAVSELRVYQKGITPLSIDWKTKAHSTYPGLGNSTLVNHQKAALNFSNPQWVGFDTIVKANVHFAKDTYIKSITVGYLVDTKSWIFPPEVISVIINKTDTVQVKMPKPENKEVLALDDVRILIEKNVESLSVMISNTKELPEWHAGKGLKAWLFMDEWIFN
ncbi:chitobiase/beta-hexosaminidase C-terminal domain-containing protein [uncultured Psychroserpens sp.]|uniref:chitobiase/beta-hexosaminidase C-terminal domain-containing protein n=1 Tax=uncultured Psychroserpens sp. TaxID=255436 RepID=UPI00260572FF|nr:chitobiase/beta-hexosaminidase C-terminal domain-containing protein [uncultured Psychroserpens sp.]